MKPITHILLPTDFSECAEKAFGLATIIAKRYSARLTTLHIVTAFDDAPYNPAKKFPDLKKYYQELEKQARKNLEYAIENDASGIEIDYAVRRGFFIYCELIKYNEASVEKNQAAKTSEELVELWKDIAENSFLNWYVNPEMPQEAANDFTAIAISEKGLDKQKKLLAELLNKNQLYVNLSEIDDADFGVGEDDKKLNRLFYGDAYNG